MDITPLGPDLLVLGGTGLLGRHILVQLLEQGIVDRTPDRVAATFHRVAPTNNRATWYPLDLADRGIGAAALVEELQPTAVINTAYINKGDALHAVTGEAPGAIAAACRRTGARFVHVSSDVVFNGQTTSAYREHDTLDPVHDYGRAKAFAEAAVAAADPAAVIVRTSLLWGRADDPGPQVEMVTNPAITFFNDEYRNPLEVSVLADACLELASRPEIAGPLHVAGGDTLDRHSFARLIAPIVGVDPASVRGAPGPVSGTRPRNCALDTSLARELLATPLPGARESLG